ncbi:MAG: hypothetical protein AB9879_01975 [Methanothrix sp.]
MAGKLITSRSPRLVTVSSPLRRVWKRGIDRRRIAAQERDESQPMQKDRDEILRALLAANSGKMLAKEMRKRMHLTKTRHTILTRGRLF